MSDASAVLSAVLVGAVVLAWGPPRSVLRPSSTGRARPRRSFAGGARGVPVRWRLLLVRQSRRDVESERRAVLEVCELLAAELAAGRPPAAALAVARDRWSPLASVVDALRLGADVPDALRRVADERRGAGDLRWLAGAWQVAHHSGRGLAAALDRTARGIRARQRTRRLVDSELASARATARLVALLPLAVLLMGSGAGSAPWAFLFATPAGWVCLTVGLGLVTLGLWWIERLADRAGVP